MSVFSKQQMKTNINDIILKCTANKQQSKTLVHIKKLFVRYTWLIIQNQYHAVFNIWTYGEISVLKVLGGAVNTIKELGIIKNGFAEHFSQFYFSSALWARKWRTISLISAWNPVCENNTFSINPFINFLVYDRPSDSRVIGNCICLYCPCDLWYWNGTHVLFRICHFYLSKDERETLWIVSCLSKYMF